SAPSPPVRMRHARYRRRRRASRPRRPRQTAPAESAGAAVPPGRRRAGRPKLRPPPGRYAAGAGLERSRLRPRSTAPRAHRRPARHPLAAARGADSPQQRPVAAFDEFQHRLHVGTAGGGDLLQFRPGFVQLRVAHVERAVGTADGRDARGVEAAPLPAFGVDAARPRVLVLRHHQERGDVAVDERAHADEGVRADAAELVHARETAEDHVVADHDMAGQRGVVGEYAVVPDHAVVGDMRVGQQPVVAADAGDPAAFAGAAIERHELADQVAVANLERDALAAVLLVLWIAADRGVSDDAVLATDARRTLHAAVRTDEGSVADLDI